jgi:integrase
MATTRPLLPDEERVIFASLERMRDQVLFLVQRMAGFRISEVRLLRVGDVWRDGNIREEIVLRRGRLKGGRGLWKRRVRERKVPVHPQLQAALQNFINKLFGNDLPDPRAYLFTGRKSRPGSEGQPISRIQAYRILRAAAAAAGDCHRVGTHSLRKAFAHEVYERSNHNLTLTQQAMGHSSVLTTVRYLELGSNAVRDAVLGLKAPIGLADKPAIAMGLEELITSGLKG